MEKTLHILGLAAALIASPAAANNIRVAHVGLRGQNTYGDKPAFFAIF